MDLIKSFGLSAEWKKLNQEHQKYLPVIQECKKKQNNPSTANQGPYERAVQAKIGM